MKDSRGKALLGLALAAAALGALMGVVGPARSLDKLPWYTATEAVKLLADLGPEGRGRYLRNECLDLVFLLVYSAFAFIATGRLWEGRLSAPAVRGGQYLSLLPGALDLAETSLVISALAGYPGGLTAKIGWLCLATPAKWLAASLLILSALCGAALSLRGPRRI
ncbi:MAG: hypothetical protein PHS14_08730 [Elusimicrobia bacterium]|nr:hypothetical protein [Elusimicrobiota bacterium]